MNTNYYAKIAKNKSLLKEYKTTEAQRSVYLNDGDEFQIQLFNPENTEISARIWIEDIRLSHDIVIRPGERIWLERYTDIAKKFKFDTYIVDGSDSITKDAISHNGNIRIEFYRRKQVNREPIWINTTTTYPNKYWEPIYDVYYNTTCASSNNSTSVSNLDMNYPSSATSANCLNGFSTLTATADYNTSINYVEPSSSTAAFDADWYKDKKNLETGRINEGGRSNQKFDNVNMEFEWWAFRTENIKIYPSSRKLYNAKDLKKLYCPNCGRKLNSKYKYCPYCGNKID